MIRALPLYPSYLQRQADTLLRDLALRESGRLAALAVDPVAALEVWPGVTLRWEAAARPSGCSVDGWYDARARTIHLVRARGSERRLNFTACHELAHHLQRHHPEVAEELARYASIDRERKLEDRICDTFASRALIPDDALPDMHRLGPTAADVIALYEQTAASRAACAVRIADRLDHEGWVIVTDLEGKVSFAAAAHHEYRLARGTPQPATSLVTTAGDRGAAQGLESVTYPSGKSGPRYNTDARAHDGYVFVVMSAGATPWAPAPVSARDRWDRPDEFECQQPACGETFVAYDSSCAICEQPHCPACGRCRCRAGIGPRLCPGCHLVQPATRFDDGSERCRDCD